MAEGTVVREINLYLNTRERDNREVSSRNSPVWTLANTITTRSPQNYFQISVKSISIPANAWYSLIGENASYTGGSSSIKKYIPDGNYNIAGILTWFNNAFATDLTASIASYQPNTISITRSGTYGLTAQHVYMSFKLAQCFGFDLTSGGWNPLGVLDPIISFNAGQSTVNFPFPYDPCVERSLFINCQLGTMNNYGMVVTNPTPIYTDPIAGTARYGPILDDRIIQRVGLLDPQYNPNVNTSYFATGAPVNYEPHNPTYTDLTSSAISFIGLSLGSESYSTLNVLLDYTIHLALLETVRPKEVNPGIIQSLTITPSYHRKGVMEEDDLAVLEEPLPEKGEKKKGKRSEEEAADLQPE